MTETTKKYTLTAHDIQAYLCDLGIKPTGEVSIYSIEYYFDKLPVNTDKLSVEKLQEQLNTAKNALSEIRENIEEHNQTYDLSVDTALLLEGIDGIAFDALAAIGGDDE